MTTCAHCGEWFTPKYENLKLCLTCYRKRERALEMIDSVERDRDQWRDLACAQHNRIYALEAQHEIAAESQPIPPDKLRMLIQLAHPDKHGNSPAANDITSWLLSLRKNRAA